MQKIAVSRRGRLVALWLVAALLLAPVLYGALPGLYNLFFGADPVAERVAVLAAGMVYLGYFGVFFALIAAVPYGALLYGWSRLCRRAPVLERSALHVAVFSAALALPIAVIGSIGAAQFAGTVRWGEALRVLPFAFLIPWGALLIPRLVIRPLKPGAFLEHPPRAAA